MSMRYGELNELRKILVVDDFRDAAEMVTAMLTLRGHRACFAVTGQDGLDLVSTFDPDVVLLDLSMPGLDGYSVARTIREQYSTDTIRLIAFTAWDDEVSRARAKAAGFDGHLPKPAALAHIIRCVEQ